MPRDKRFTEADPVSPEQIEAARQDKISATKHGLLVSLAPAAAVVAFSPIVPAALGQFSSFWSGVHYKPHPGGGVSARMGIAAGALYLAPIPLGVIPPEYYGIDPSIVPHTVGNIPGQKTVGLKASEIRETVFNAREREVILIAEFNRTFGFRAAGDIPTEQLVKDLAFLRATTHQEQSSAAVLAALELKVPERLEFDREQAQLANPVPVPVPIAPQIVVPVASSQPESDSTFGSNAVFPITLLSLGVAAAARGIAKELITERTDP